MTANVFGTANLSYDDRMKEGSLSMGNRAVVSSALVTALLVLPTLSTHLARAARPAAVPADTLIVAAAEAPVDLDPASSYDSQAAAVLRGEYESLVRLSGSSTTDIIGALAQSWSVNAAHTVYTFHLRHGVTFHDGTPFNAEAVRASYTRELSLNQGPAFIIG